jgi:hypothetical protein
MIFRLKRKIRKNLPDIVIAPHHGNSNRWIEVEVKKLETDYSFIEAFADKPEQLSYKDLQLITETHSISLYTEKLIKEFKSEHGDYKSILDFLHKPIKKDWGSHIGHVALAELDWSSSSNYWIENACLRAEDTLTQIKPWETREENCWLAPTSESIWQFLLESSAASLYATGLEKVVASVKKIKSKLCKRINKLKKALIKARVWRYLQDRRTAFRKIFHLFSKNVEEELSNEFEYTQQCFNKFHNLILKSNECKNRITRNNKEYRIVAQI